MATSVSVSRAVRTGKNAAMLLLGTAARMVASFVFVLWSASALGLVGFGKLSLATLYFELSLSLAATAVGILLTRDVARWPRRLNELVTSAVLLAVALCGAVPFVLIPLARASGYAPDTIAAMAIGCVALFPSAICVVIDAVFIARERAEFATMGAAVESVLRIGLSLAALRLGYGLLALMWVLVAVRGVLLVAYLVGLRQLTRTRWVFSVRSARRFAMRWRVFAAENWMATIYTNLDVLVLSWAVGEAAVGLYSASWKFVRLGTAVARSFTTAVFPVMTRMYSESRDSFQWLFRSTIRVMSAFVLPAVIGMSVLAERIVGVLYTEEYAEAVPVLRVLAWVLLVEFLNPFLSHVLFAQGKQHCSMYVAAISLVVNVVTTCPLVFQYGAVGAALGCVLGGFAGAISYLLFAMPQREVVRTMATALRVLVAAAGMGIAVYLLRDATWFVVGVVTLPVYAALLLAVQAVGIDDLRFFKATFLSRAPA